MNAGEHLEITRRFAVALDTEDYAAAAGLLDAGCVYVLGGKVFEGPSAIVASYQGNGDEAAKKFDSCTYGSEVRVGTGQDEGWCVIRFSDHLTHGGKKHSHYCEQRVRVEEGCDAGLIVRIEHREMEGETERLSVFKAGAGLG